MRLFFAEAFAEEISGQPRGWLLAIRNGMGHFSEQDGKRTGRIEVDRMLQIVVGFVVAISPINPVDGGEIYLCIR